MKYLFILALSVSFLFCQIGPVGGGGTIPSTTNVLKGDGAGNAAAVSGTSTNCVLVNGTNTVCAGSVGSATLQAGNITGLCSSDNNQRYYWTSASAASYSIPPAPSVACSVILQNNDPSNALSITNAGAQTVNGQTSGLAMAACTAPTNGCPVKVLSWDLTNSVWIFGNPTTPGASGIGYGGSSTASLPVATGSTTFGTQAGLGYVAGANSYVTACSASAPTACMTGPVTSYSGTTLVLNVTSTTGSGTHADWVFTVSGPTGATGSNGTNGTNGTNGAISQIQQSGSAKPVEPFLNFTGSGLSGCADNPGATRTDCTFSAGQSVYPSTSILGAEVGESSSAGSLFSASHQSCAAGKLTFWPVSGWFVSLGQVLTGAQTLAGYTGLVPCSPSAAVSNGGPGSPMLVNIAPGAATGGYVNTFAYDGLHVNVGTQLASIFSLTTLGGGTGVTFVADSGNTTVLGAAPQAATVLSTTAYIGFGHTSAAYCSTELNCAIPMPIGGTWSLFAACTSTTPTSSITLAFRVNGASSGTPSTLGGTSGTTVGCNLYDTVDSASTSAGDYVDTQYVSGIGTPAVIDWIASAFTASSGMPIWSLVSGTVGATQTYALPFTAANSTTFTSAETVITRPCTASKLYATQSGNNGAGVSTTYGLYRATGTTGTPTLTALTGTIATGAGNGSTLVDGTDTVALSAGDRIALGYIAAGGTSPTIGGISVLCQ